MPTPPERPPVSPCAHEDLIDNVVARFAVYARARSARGSILGGTMATPRQEQQAFDDLQDAVARLRAWTG
ncbi:hypothetical protein ACFU6I_24270 [Streptomyces sp. NPDC057486]|uniref:hypothetical protein n=1 Tax=Streptomyces sp. NPDC057486 TaxID=3346145 RepID=UPI0036C128A9